MLKVLEEKNLSYLNYTLFSSSKSSNSQVRFFNQNYIVCELNEKSFDDSFEFLGKRTTGGLKRRVEVPQFTQVGNAVPPLLARAVAEEIMKVL